MPDRVPFCRIKLQYLAEAVSDPSLDDNAFRVIAYLALIHADQKTGEARPKFATIGEAIGRHAKSVKRALGKAEDAGYLEIERGTNIGNSSRYRPTESALERASERRKEADKIVPLSRSKGGQNCPQRGTDVSSKGGQKRPPNLDQELRNGAHGAELAFTPLGSAAAREWQSLCDRHIGLRLDALIEAVTHREERGLFLPSKWPPADRAEWPEMAHCLLSQKNGQEAEAAHG